MITMLDDHEAGARRALLERLAAGLAVIAEPHRHEWTCCWLSYTGPGGVVWLWKMCGGCSPGGLPSNPAPCGHWHHQAEVFLG
jgi:hypothetical protein